MFLNVSFCGFVGVVSHMSSVPPRRMRMVPRLFVMPSLVMLCRFVMVMSGMRTMFRCLFVMFACFFRHGVSFSIFVPDTVGLPDIQRRWRGYFSPGFIFPPPCMSLTVEVSPRCIKPLPQPALNSLASIVPSLSLSTM